MKALMAAAALLLISIAIPERIPLKGHLFGGHFLACRNDWHTPLCKIVCEPGLESAGVGIKAILDATDQNQFDVSGPIYDLGIFLDLSGADLGTLRNGAIQLAGISREYSLPVNSGIVAPFPPRLFAKIDLGVQNTKKLIGCTPDWYKGIFNHDPRSHGLANILNVDLRQREHTAVFGYRDAHECLLRLNAFHTDPWPILSLHNADLAGEDDGLPRGNASRYGNDANANNSNNERDLIEAIMLGLIGIAAIWWGIWHAATSDIEKSMQQFLWNVMIAVAGSGTLVLATAMTLSNIF